MSNNEVKVKKFWVIYKEPSWPRSKFIGAEAIECESIVEAREMAIKRANKMGNDIEVDFIKELITK